MSHRRSFPFNPALAAALAGLAISCGGGGGSSSAPPPALTVTEPAPAILGFTATPGTISTGLNATLAWNVSNATSLSIDPGVGSVTGPTGSVSVSPAASTLYTLTATNAGGVSKASAQVTFSPAPGITGFTATPPSVPAGGTVTLTATFTNGTGTISRQTGSTRSVLATGLTSPASVQDTPGASTTYTLTVTDAANVAQTAQTRVLAGSLTVLAGVPSGLGNVDGTGPGARFYRPTSVAVDALGNTYVADQQNDVIRMIAPGGAVTTIAGTAGIGGAGDSPARFNVPTGLAVDGGGNVYVADSGNAAIRRITPSGTAPNRSYTVTTLVLAGGAVLARPEGVAVDGGGNLYVADSGGNAIDLLAPAAPGTYAVTRLTVNGLPPFSSPVGVAVDGSGNVYVADSGNNAIDLLTPVPATPGSYTGTALAGTFDAPQGVAVDGSGNVYVADSGGEDVQVISGGTTTTFGTGGRGSSDTAPVTFDGPLGLAFGAGTIYVADAGSDAIRTITFPGGAVGTLAGLPGDPGYADSPASPALFNDAYGLAVDASGNVYVADQDNNVIRMITPGGTVSTLAAGFNGPTAVALDPTQKTLYVADAGNNAIDAVTIADGAVSLLATGTTGASPVPFSNPLGVAVDSNGYVYVADHGNNAIRIITPAGVAGSLVTSVATYAAVGVSGPAGIAVDASGNVYEADGGTNAILNVKGGTAVLLAGGHLGSADGQGAAAQFNSPFGVAVDAAGNVYVPDNINNTLRMITPAGLVTTVVGQAGTGIITPGPLPALLAYPWGVAVDPAGNPVITVSDAVLHITD